MLHPEVPRCPHKKRAPHRAIFQKGVIPVIRKAFTLIELLVVVAIITVLIALLIPFLGKARDNAKRAVCLAHLKQVGTAFYAYAGNNNQMVPDGGNVQLGWNQQTGITSTAQLNTWQEELVIDGAVQERFKENGLIANTQYFAAGWGIFFCPSSISNNRPDMQPKLEGNGANTNATYGMCYYAGSIWYLNANAGVTAPIPFTGSTDPKASNTSAIYYPHSMKTNYWVTSHIIVAEAFNMLAISGEPPSGDPATINNTPTEPTVRANCGATWGVWLRHFKGANYLMADAHAEWSDKYHAYDSTKPNINREASADPVSSTHQPQEYSLWGHNPNGIKAIWR
jgi:prepilin-type N-terminal cleavage/methylation domain-containing protein/prepilin-type processing-associated H-X9-DG protein